MATSNPGKLHAYDPKIDKTFHKLIRSHRSSEVANSSHKSSAFASDYGILKSNSGDFDFDIANSNSNLDVVYQLWCIRYPEFKQAQSYELKFGVIHLLPKFHGLVGEDPRKHLKEFHVVCSILRPYGILEDYIKMKAFPFSLDGAANGWLYLQPALSNPGNLHTYDPEIDRTFHSSGAGFDSNFGVSISQFSLNNMENNDKTLKELAIPDVKTLHKHLNKFHVVCSTMRPYGIHEDYIKMKAFPFSLDGAAKDWLYL
ncbi:hypothetical protein CR513_21686, partial [Mucuna pruriens]